MQILHRDLKCANVFLTKNGSAKLGDMNVSKVAKAGMVYPQAEERLADPALSRRWRHWCRW